MTSTTAAALYTTRVTKGTRKSKASAITVAVPGAARPERHHQVI